MKKPKWIHTTVRDREAWVVKTLEWFAVVIRSESNEPEGPFGIEVLVGGRYDANRDTRFFKRSDLLIAKQAALKSAKNVAGEMRQSWL